MATVSPAPTLPCKECGFVNEPERVYCHNCGAKLDRSLLPKEDQLRREPPERARRRIMRMTNPGQGVIKREIFALMKTLIFAALAAMILVALKEPTNVPPEKGELSTRLVGSDLSELMTSRTPRAIAFSQGELNTFLASGKVKKEPNLGVVYKRSFVNLQPGVARVTIQKSFWGYSLYTGTLMRTEANAGVFFATNVGGNIGRLAIHPRLMQYLTPFLFKDLAVGLKPEIEALKKSYALRVEKDRVIIATNGGVKP